jgi:hypothetical protein
VTELASRLRAHPEGDLTLTVAPVALGLAVFVGFARVDRAWADFPLLLLLLIPSLSLAFLALAPRIANAPGEGDQAHFAPWQTASLLTAILLFTASLEQTLGLFGHDSPGNGALTWILLLSGAIAAVLSVRYDSPGLTVLASLAIAGAFVIAIRWIDSHAHTATYRDVVLLEGALFLALARLTWEARRRALVFAAFGGALLITGAILGNPNVAPPIPFLDLSFSLAKPKEGWTFVLIAVSIGMLAFGAWQRHGPSAVIGLLGAYAFYVSSIFGGDLSGWPLLLGLTAAACFAWALVVRPARAAAGNSTPPAPPAPPAQPPPT